MTDTLSLQDLELPVETKADLYRSANSIYVCLATSTVSLVC